MSKILVNEMPDYIEECPFFNFMKYGYCMAHGGICKCTYDERTQEIDKSKCDWLMELPKGDKENGSSQD